MHMLRGKVKTEQNVQAKRKVQNHQNEMLKLRAK